MKFIFFLYVCSSFLIFINSTSVNSETKKICTISKKVCSSEFIYENKTHKSCIQMIGNRSWCLLKHKLEINETFQIGINYDECVAKCPVHYDHQTSVFISFGVMVLLVGSFFFITGIFFKGKVCCFKRNMGLIDESLIEAVGTSSFVPLQMRVNNDEASQKELNELEPENSIETSLK